MHKSRLREIYTEASERIDLATELFGAQDRIKAPVWPKEENLEAIAQSLTHVQQEIKEEEDNAYKATILELCRWLKFATKSEFLRKHENRTPHAHYVVQRGLNVLHMLMRRDLRRKAFSNTESQVYYEFVRLTAELKSQDSSTSKKAATSS